MSERHHHQHHHQNHEHQQRYDRQFVQPQFHYPQHYHGGHYQDPYRGMNNYWRDSRQDYYHDHHHHRDRNNFIPRMLEGILGGLLDGSLGRELDKLGVDGKQKRTVEAYDDNDRLERAAFAENESPERQISMDLDFSPPQASGKESRFERTG